MVCSEVACMLQKSYDLKVLEVAKLTEIVSKLSVAEGYIFDTWQTWARSQKEKSLWYEQTIAFPDPVATPTTTIQLDFQNAQTLNSIILNFDDGTAKDVQIRAYTNPADGLYALIRKLTTNTSPDLRETEINEKYLLNSRIEFYFANYTQGKRCKITVQADLI